MADNFLERQRRDYDAKKAQWQKTGKRPVSVSQILKRSAERFSDE